MKMIENFKILAEFVKDLSSETPDVQTYIYVKENILKYQIDLDITSKALKNKMIEINTKLRFSDKELTEKKSYFEIIYTSVVKINDKIKDKKELEKIILCDVPNKIWPKLKKVFLDLVHNSGFPEVKLETKIDFEKLYVDKAN
jgi:preprotein translocase subunit SecB